MKNILLANIGNRNITFSGDHVSKNTYYTDTKEIFDHIDDFQEGINIHIIDVLVDKYEVDEIHLFVTNQKPKPYHQDTYYVGKIIEHLRGDTYTIHIHEQHHDPRHREQSFHFFEQFFKEYEKELLNNRLIVSGSGGIPAMKEALNFYAVYNSGNVTITDVDENTNDLFVSNIATVYLQNMQKRTLMHMIESYDYHAAYGFLRDSLIEDPTLEKVLLYLHRRYHFNFAGAEKYINEVHSLLGDTVQVLPGDSDDRQEHLTFQEIMIQELLHNIQISYQKGEYGGVIAKAYALEDNLYIYIFEKLTSISAEDIPTIEAKQIPTERISSGKKIVKSYRLKDYCVTNYPNDAELQMIDNLGKKLKQIKDPRNISIMAHGFGPITRDYAQDIYDHVENYISYTQSPNPYIDFNEKISLRLQG